MGYEKVPKATVAVQEKQISFKEYLHNMGFDKIETRMLNKELNNGKLKMEVYATRDRSDDVVKVGIIKMPKDNIILFNEDVSNMREGTRIVGLPEGGIFLSNGEMKDKPSNFKSMLKREGHMEMDDYDSFQKEHSIKLAMMYTMKEMVAFGKQIAKENFVQVKKNFVNIVDDLNNYIASKFQEENKSEKIRYKSTEEALAVQKAALDNVFRPGLGKRKD